MTNCGCIYTFEVRLNGESGVVAKSIDELREPPDVKLSSFNILMRYDFNYCQAAMCTVAMCADTVQLTSRYSNSSSAKNVFGGVASRNAPCVQQCGTAARRPMSAALAQQSLRHSQRRRSSSSNSSSSSVTSPFRRLMQCCIRRQSA